MRDHGPTSQNSLLAANRYEREPSLFRIEGQPATRLNQSFRRLASVSHINLFADVIEKEKFLADLGNKEDAIDPDEGFNLTMFFEFIDYLLVICLAEIDRLLEPIHDIRDKSHAAA